MMGNRQKLKSGLEEDVVHARNVYCYLDNNYSLVKFVKRQLSKRRRKQIKNKIKEILNEEGI